MNKGAASKRNKERTNALDRKAEDMDELHPAKRPVELGPGHRHIRQPVTKKKT